MTRGYVRILFCFPFPEVSKWSAATAQIKKGFRATLQRWPYLAGTIGPVVNSRPSRKIEIRYRDEFTDIGSAAFAVKRYWQDSDMPWQYETLSRTGMPPSDGVLHGTMLSPLPDIADPTMFSPVCAVQANFIEGGLILSVYYHHAVMDGTGGRQFYHVLADNIRTSGKSGPNKPEDPSTKRLVVPHRASLTSKELPIFPDYDFSGPPGTSSGEVASRIFTFSSARISGLKEAVLSRIRRDSVDSSEPRWASTFDCLAALIWTYVTRARSHHVHTNTHTKLGVAVNIRSKIEPSLPDNYFGNAAMSAPAETTFKQLADSNQDVLECIAHAALTIRRAINSVDNNYVQQRLALFASVADVSAPPVAILKALNLAGNPGTGLYITSWAEFGADADFGIEGTTEGCAEWIRKPLCGDEGGNIVLPRRGGMKGNANWEVLVQVRRLEMRRLASEGELGGWAERIVE
ncbi:hypothetical protein K490DRAFT_62652 [Saccharata proteae CBS 121410]|uniref:Uncharacterized protein n=1 Tax=Saccharata proteae CBS 121410 TaxID=1314787 RepID=A0A9P4HXM6_9PEZI|nr:hypothetical protein K490DRAFT_62652 [Saccharata proteae CBS 121410]